MGEMGREYILGSNLQNVYLYPLENHQISCGILTNYFAGVSTEVQHKPKILIDLVLTFCCLRNTIMCLYYQQIHQGLTNEIITGQAELPFHSGYLVQ